MSEFKWFVQSKASGLYLHPKAREREGLVYLTSEWRHERCYYELPAAKAMRAAFYAQFGQKKTVRLVRVRNK